MAIEREIQGALQVEELALLLDAVQLAIELGSFGILCRRLLQELAGRRHGHAHFIHRHVFDQLERQHAYQRQSAKQHEGPYPTVP